MRHEVVIGLVLLAVVGWLGCSKTPKLDAVGSGGSSSGSSKGSSGSSGSAPQAGPPVEIWRPTPGTTWQWQLQGTIDTSLAVAMYDVDLFDTPDAVVATLHQRGVKITCYFSAGSREDWRADVGALPPAVLGRPLEGWPTERWLDVRAPEVRALMTTRLQRAKDRGCDAVEPDNVDGFQNATGFPLTAADQLDYNRFLAREAHARGLSIGLKNDLDQVAALVGDFDWALTEECATNHECGALAPFIAANKAVFHVEYGTAAIAAKVCRDANARNFDTLIKKLDLDAWRIACR